MPLLFAYVLNRFSHEVARDVKILLFDGGVQMRDIFCFGLSSAILFQNYAFFHQKLSLQPPNFGLK